MCPEVLFLYLKPHGDILKVFLETSSKLEKISFSPSSRPLDADEVMRWFNKLKKKYKDIFIFYFKRKDYKSLPTN